jgi:hypothetical protein
MNFEIPIVHGNFSHVDSWVLWFFATNQECMVYRGTRDDQLWLRRRCRQCGLNYQKKRSTLVIKKSSGRLKKTDFRREDFMWKARQCNG